MRTKHSYEGYVYVLITLWEESDYDLVMCCWKDILTYKPMYDYDNDVVMIESLFSWTHK